MFTEALQDEFVVQQAMQGAQQEDVEGQVADLLLLKVPTEPLQPPGGAAGALHLQQHLGVPLEVHRQLLLGRRGREGGGRGGCQWQS